VEDRDWKISATVVFPKLVVPLEPPETGSLLPKKIGFQSRVTGKTVGNVEGLGDVVLEPSPHSILQPPDNCDLVVLSFGVRAGTPELGLSKTESSLELLMDDVSFQLQTPIRPLMLEVLDVSPPLETGMEREVLVYPYPIGWPYPKFQESQFLSDTTTAIVPAFRDTRGFRHERVRAALRWYVKALATPFDVDQFAILWIALEIICSEGGSGIEKPYRASCGHEIKACPQCGKTTSREVQGPTLISFLSDELGVQTADAKELWRTRQMFHGSNELTRESIENLPRLLLTLKAAVVRGLKVASGQPALTLPYVVDGKTGISKAVALGGTRRIEPQDLP
jgi:hypothetical protein